MDLLLPFFLLLFWVLLGLICIVRCDFQLIRQVWNRSHWCAIGIGMGLLLVILYGGNKPNGTPPRRSAPQPRSPASPHVRFSENHWQMGIVLAEVRTNADFSLKKPNHGSVYIPWQRRGAHQDGFWMTIPSFPLAGYTYSSAYISSCGTIAFNRPKGAARVKEIPDGTSTAFLAPFHASLGVVPEGNWNKIHFSTNSLFWSECTSRGVTRLTWQNVLLERDADCPISFQAELRPNGDCIYRYDFSKLSDWNGSITNAFEIGIQTSDAGESAIPLLNENFSGLTTLPSKFELVWKSIARFSREPTDFDDDGLTDVEEIFHTHTDATFGDSDLDRISDYDETIQGTNPRKPNLSSVGSIAETVFGPQYSNNFYRVNIELEYLEGESVVLAVGEYSALFDEVHQSIELWLEKGVAHPIRLYAEKDINVLFSTDYTDGMEWCLIDEIPLFQSPQDFQGEAIHEVGILFHPILASPSGYLCFHSKNALAIQLQVLPDLTGGFHWSYSNPELVGFSESVRIPYYPPSLSGKTLSVEWTHESGRSWRWDCGVTYCRRSRAEPPFDQYEENHCNCSSEMPEGDGTNQWGTAYPPDTFRIPVNDDDDNGNFLIDLSDEYQHSSDNDLLAFTPMISPYLNACCPCPDHQKPSAQTATLLESSPRLALWADSHKQNKFGGELSLDAHVYIEGLHPSTSINGERMIWSCYDAVKGYFVCTNYFTVLGQRIFVDSDLDGEVNENDIADQSSSGSFSGTWHLPLQTNHCFAIRLRTQVKLSGQHRLSLNPRASCVIWTTPNPTPHSQPLVRPGETILCGENGAQWNLNNDAILYVQPIREGYTGITYSFSGTGDAEGMYCGTTQTIVISPISLIANYNRDAVISNEDEISMHHGRPLRMWINDDYDEGNVASGDSNYPSSFCLSRETNTMDKQVNGRADLLDFFPVLIDLGEFPSHYTNLTYRLSQAQGDVNILWTSLCRTNIQSYLTTDSATYGEYLNQLAHAATVVPATSENGTLPSSFVTFMQEHENQGVVLLEGTYYTTKPLKFSIYQGADLIAETILPLRIDTVPNFFRFHNIREHQVSIPNDEEPINLPDSELLDKDVFFIHGFNISENDAFSFGSEVFKRLWQQGSHARFHLVTWDGNLGSSLEYATNVNNAFSSASNLAACVQRAIPDTNTPVVLIAHSLGNMITSAAIQDFGLKADAYFALNGAVPAEAYESNWTNVNLNPSNPLVHPHWEDYDPRSWASCYHTLFSDPLDDRTKLHWVGRFKDVGSILYNFWSSGDEVLEISDSTVWVTSGFDFAWDWPPYNFSRYAWHKQALFKGRSSLANLEWAGWGFESMWASSTKSWLRSIEYLQTNMVFKHQPAMMFTSNIVQSVQNELLSRAIPELSYPIGYHSILNMVKEDEDMNTDKEFRRDDHAWPTRTFDFSTQKRPRRWLHSDFVNVAHFYTYKLYDQIISQGELR